MKINLFKEKLPLIYKNQFAKQKMRIYQRKIYLKIFFIMKNLKKLQIKIIIKMEEKKEIYQIKYLLNKIIHKKE